MTYDPIKLIEQIDSTTKNARPKNVDISFNELFDMFKSKELIISPDFQRLFRWDEIKQSQFIESLILELPIPPIYVIEKEEGIYELIDGLQRISSYFHFRGTKSKLDENTGDFLNYEEKQLTLTGCDILNNLNGLTHDNLPNAIRIKLKRHFIRMEVLRQESNNKLKYHIFKRLNTGGELLSEQELRNCTIRLLDSTFINFLKAIVKENSYKNCMKGLTEEKQQQMYLEECALRFFAFKNYRQKYSKNIGDFLTKYMEVVSDKDAEEYEIFNYELEKSNFISTFGVLGQILDEFPFSSFNEKGNSQGNFSILIFEAITLGIQNHLLELQDLTGSKLKKLVTRLIDLKKDEQFQKLTKGGGKNYLAALNNRISYVDTWLSNNL